MGNAKWLGAAWLLAELCTLQLLATPCAVHAQSKPTAAQMAARTKINDAARARYDAWLNAPWSADPGTEYVDIERHIDQEIASRQNPDAIFNFYKSQLLRKPTDPTAIVGYVYTAYVLDGRCSPGEDLSKAKDFIVETVGYKGQALPHTYSIVRLAILVLPMEPVVVPVAHSLLAANPNDVDVKYALGTGLGCSTDLGDRETAYKYAQDLAKERPYDIRSFELLKIIDWRTAWLTHDQAVADRCISEYQRCADMSPAGSEARQSDEAEIVVMQRLKAKWAASSRGAGQADGQPEH
jgi:hypothetical protein